MVMTRKKLSASRGPGDFQVMAEEIPSYGAALPFEILVHHFASNDFKLHADMESKTVQFFISGDCAFYNCRLQLTHDDELMQVRVHYPVSARDPKIRPLVAEALARANYGMSIGGFDIDMDSGEMNYHVGQVIRGRELDDDIIGGVFSSALSAADRYFPAIMRVMFAGHTPADAVYLSELDAHAEAVEAGESSLLAPPQPVAKKRKAHRKGPRSKMPRELPDLFDDPPSPGSV
jgi:hypothetical protein